MVATIAQNAEPVLHRGRGPAGGDPGVDPEAPYAPAQVAHRIAITFGTFGVATGFLWRAVGPDARPAQHDRPVLAAPDLRPADL